jgi:hypothetical protein
MFAPSPPSVQTALKAKTPKLTCLGVFAFLLLEELHMDRRAGCGVRRFHDRF